ncbi:ATP-binding protein [Bifidobacterium sp. ESL0790]|uniref:ATP-binding protein n=1 Tax=Bifidobacterium sp. ESL0790 TaxID=2983233 RepID=UPI0023F94F83|nr:ATP-binding protein [Bifidobacterium sp. ESL0790]WEV71843.1 ATP-binding protein [Bifidobacterium sp. ESL0790]
MIPRQLEARLRKMATWFPVISLTGPRQSGKSTLIREAFPDYDYINLEDENIRAIASDDPVGFIRNRPRRLILDEVQYVPSLFSSIQVFSDESQAAGQYILSGSQNFLLLKRIRQSLAGRVGILRLLPFSFAELENRTFDRAGIRFGDGRDDVDAFMLRGGYPRLYGSDIERLPFFASYENTYIARDVADYLDVRNVSAFGSFLRLCAQQVGNLINYSNMARDVGVDVRTVKSWLSILESSYIALPLMPYHRNPGKRLTKTPKLYFYDTGLLCHLLRIRSLGQLLTHPMLGAIFENLIVSETVKRYTNAGQEPELYFYRDEDKREVDLIDLTDPGDPGMFEIKASETYHGKFAKTLTGIGQQLGIPAEHRAVVYRGSMSSSFAEFNLVTAPDYLGREAKPQE